jgi:peptidoglycan/LPS O-acetylase OafA/YrhL
MERTVTTRVPAIDGLRGLAIILVLLGHLNIPGLEGFAPLGVMLFFVLSGYLITGILTRQVDEGGVHFAEFYARRARRLFPALLPMVVVAAFLLGDGWWPQTWHALLYLGNLPLMRGELLGNIGHTWSLAVEEHFYIVWPIVIALIPARQRFRVVAAAVLVFGAWRLGLIASGANVHRIYYATDTNAFPLLAGCLLSVGRFPRFSPITGVIASLAFVAVEAVGTTTLPLLFLSVPLAAVMVHVASTGVPAFEIAWVRWLGSISYGIYLWHAPLFDQFDAHRPLVVPVVILIAWLSWKLLEEPILKRSNPASPRRDRRGFVLGQVTHGVPVALASVRPLYQRPVLSHQASFPQVSTAVAANN